MGARRKSEYPPGAFFVADDRNRPKFKDSGGKVHKQASQAYYELVELLFAQIDPRRFTMHANVELRAHLPKFKFGYIHGEAAVHMDAPDMARWKAMNQLFLEVQKAIEQAHQSGIERGKSLLVQLAQGGITAKQLNDHSLKGEDEVDELTTEYDGD